jgi:hypothetical protein
MRTGCATALRANVSAEHSFAGPCGLGLVAMLLAVTPAVGQGEPSSLPFELRVQGSFPLQYNETLRGSGANQSGISAAPYFSMMAIRELQPGLTTAAFAEAGHAPLGQFRDNDNTFTSFGGNIVQRWGQFSLGTSLEHTHFYNGVFDTTSSIANDVNVFARYVWMPGADVRVTPSATANLRLDDMFAAQRYTASGRLDVERRLVGSWWLVAIPRVRYSEYVGAEAGRRDFTASIVAGVKYQFNDSISVSALAGYENRMSNIADKDRERFVAGVSVDYEFAVGSLTGR